MKGKVFFDTNILLYAYGDDEPSRRSTCIRLVKEVFNGEREGAISNQVLGEFSNVLINKLGASVEDTERAVGEFIESANWTKFNYDYRTIKKALAACRAHKTPFWDAVIAETMKENQVMEIITENEKDFSSISGIRVINPFK